MYRLILILLIIFSVAFISEGQITNTPVRVDIPTSAPPATAGVSPTPIPPTFTPTEEGIPQLQVPPESGDVNVRSEPDPESEILGTIRSGDLYTVTGRYYQWVQFRFDPSPTRLGYVFGELVNVTGDETRIPDLTQSGVATQDIAVVNSTETAAAVQQTPGFDLTLTADSRFIEAPSGDVLPEVTSDVSGPVIALPTFTPPPNVVALASTPDAQSTAAPPTAANNVVEDGIAPIIPIVVLAALGLIGLLLSVYPRNQLGLE